MANLQDLLDFDMNDIMRMSGDEVKQLAADLGYRANVRYNRLKRAGIKTPATYGFERSGGLASTRNKDRNQLLHEIFRTRNFLESESSTIRGYKAQKSRAEEQIRQSAAEIGIDLTDEHLSDYMMRRLYSGYRKLREMPGTKAISTNIIKALLYDYIAKSPDKRKISVDELVDEGITNLTNFYEGREEGYDDQYDFSGEDELF